MEKPFIDKLSARHRNRDYRLREAHFRFAQSVAGNY
jgi:hypothetical protein